MPIRGFEPTQEDYVVRDNHLSILKQGVEAWNRWRNTNPDIKPMLFDADLTFLSVDPPTDRFGRTNVGIIEIREVEKLDLRSANLCGSNLYSASLPATNFEGCWAQHTNFRDADLRFASFRQGWLTGADFRGADLRSAKLGGKIEEPVDHASAPPFYGATSLFDRAQFDRCNLEKADLDGIYIRSASFSEANLSGARGFVPDGNYLRGARLSLGVQGHWGRAKDPWTLLQRSYSGLRLVMNLLFLVLFFLPYAGRAILWSAYDRLQDIEGQTLISPISHISVQFADIQIWELLIGLDKGLFTWLTSVILIAYNVTKALLTILVSSLRDEQERTGCAPALRGVVWVGLRELGQYVSNGLRAYGWMTHMHKVLRVVFFIAISMACANLYSVLAAPIHIPILQD